jgi:hypothetical protein
MCSSAQKAVALADSVQAIQPFVAIPIHPLRKHAMTTTANARTPASNFITDRIRVKQFMKSLDAALTVASSANQQVAL